MKRNHHIIIALTLTLFCIAASGCKDNQTGISKYKWPIINTDFDRCVDRLEEAYIYSAPDSVIQQLTDSLTIYLNQANVSQIEKNQLSNRVTYWKARIAGNNNLLSERNKLIKSALESTDSSRFAYDYNRFKIFNLKSDPNVYQTGSTIVTLTSSESFFANRNDSVYLADVYVQLSNMYFTWQYNKEAKDFLIKASHIFTDLHMDDYSTKIKLNLAMC
ncbi:MAG: hypothetical protein ACI4UL_03545 [Muribaculaceae bacterium]